MTSSDWLLLGVLGFGFITGFLACALWVCSIVARALGESLFGLLKAWFTGL